MRRTSVDETTLGMKKVESEKHITKKLPPYVYAPMLFSSLVACEVQLGKACPTKVHDTDEATERFR